MKKTKTSSVLIAGLLGIMLLFSILPLVIAEENETSQLSEEAIQEINNGLNEPAGNGKMFGNKLGLFFTFNSEKKAEKELKLARLELIRARIANENNNAKALEHAFENHNRWMKKVEFRINKTNEKPTRQGINESLTKLVGLERAIEVHEFHVDRINALIANNSNLTEAQIEQMQEKIANIEENIASLKEVQDSKKDKLKTKLMAVSNLTEEEAENEIEKIESFQNLSEVQKFVAEKRIEKTEEQISHFQEKIDEAKDEGRNTSNAEARLIEIENGLSKATSLYEAGNYSEALSQLNMGRGIEKQVIKEVREQERERKEQSFGSGNGSGYQNQIREREENEGDMNGSEDKICCKIYGYGAYMEEVNVEYSSQDKGNCAISEGFVGGNREVVDDSYCGYGFKKGSSK